MPIENDTRKMIPVTTQTHQELKALSKQEELKFPDLVEMLLKSHKMLIAMTKKL